MSSAPPSSPAIEIRHGQMPLVVARLRGPDVDAALAELEQRYGDAPGFFEDEPLLLDLSEWTGADRRPTPLERQALLDGLQRIGLRPLAFHGGPHGWQSALRERGLAAGEVQGPVAVRGTSPKADSPVTTAATPPAPSAPPLPSAALVVDRPLRSGQQVYARGRDLVVLAMVNPGAEVIADGHIHVYAPLRGKAIAGARGLTEARVFALALEPELVSIAGVYRTAETPWPDAVRGKPAQVRLASGPDGDKLLLEPLS
ncbi:septum site-determining protein MinC [Tepidimonas fonticaldi]|uniref:Probable septum site-determining protein MinC n=1 Tax=Tepidimonas fonticaldi TaxID=1101373 RepID=A0A1A6DWC5_9BURK|nr:septum site-determining protein MinC [Tepidimonas fonticaldi]OBS31153.1 septum site-determining protein MinC [Tepidimonas fonticaldi]